MARTAALNGKVALITGGGTGIGEAIAERFVEEGAKVCIAGRRKAPLETVVGKLPAGSAVGCTGDVSNIDDVRRMVQTALDMGGRLDVLVNSAGIAVPGSVTELDPADWQQALAVNLTGPFLAMRTVIPHLIRKGGGSIINISSIGGIRVIPMASSYCTTKAALVHLSKQVALDYASQGVRCNVVIPGFVRTDMLDFSMDILAQMKGTDREGAYRLIEKQNPVGWIAAPRDIAGICLYLASDESAYMTGAELVVDGGGAFMDAGTMVFRT